MGLVHHTCRMNPFDLCNLIWWRFFAQLVINISIISNVNIVSIVHSFSIKTAVNTLRGTTKYNKSLMSKHELVLNDVILILAGLKFKDWKTKDRCRCVSGHAGQAFNTEQQSCSLHSKEPSSCSSRWGNNRFLHVVTCWQITLFKPIATAMCLPPILPLSRPNTAELNIKQSFNSNQLMWDINHNEAEQHWGHHHEVGGSSIFFNLPVNMPH